MPAAADRPLALVTGAAAGLGLQTAAGLLRAGCDVILTDRNCAAGGQAAAQLGQRFPDAEVSFRELDLASLAGIAEFTADWIDSQRGLDILVNNAGLYPPFRRATTSDGFELGFGVSFYGHFALTAGLLPALLRADTARVVCVSSIAHASGRIDTGDPRLERDYDCNRAYSRCKLACLIFALELDRRARAAGVALRAMAAHPGIARTRIGQHDSNQAQRLREKLIKLAMRLAMRALGQPAEAGALPLIHAATAPELAGGEFIGPDGLGQFRGKPALVRPRARALAACDPAALWAMAEEQTGASFHWTSP